MIASHPTFHRVAWDSVGEHLVYLMSKIYKRRLATL